MKKENKKPILSKRVLICLVIALFLIIAFIFIRIISRENDNSLSYPSDASLNKSNLSETKENDYGYFPSGSLFDNLLGIPGILNWILIILGGVIGYRVLFGKRRLFRI